jgi:hypothetical protein
MVGTFEPSIEGLSRHDVDADATRRAAKRKHAGRRMVGTSMIQNDADTVARTVRPFWTMVRWRNSLLGTVS